MVMPVDYNIWDEGFNEGFKQAMDYVIEAEQEVDKQQKPTDDEIEQMLWAYFDNTNYREVEEMRKIIERWLFEAYRRGVTDCINLGIEDVPYDRSQEDMRE